MKSVNTKDVWHKLLSRQGVDITTISGIDEIFYENIFKIVGIKNKEVFLLYFITKILRIIL